MGPRIQSQVQGVNQRMDLITSTGCKSEDGFDHKYRYKLNHGFDPTTNTSNRCKWNYGFDPTTDTSTGCKWDHGFDPTPNTSTGVNGTMDLITGTICMVLTPQQTQEKGVNETMSLTPQQTQIQGVNGTMDLITSTGSKSDRGFDHKYRE